MLLRATHHLGGAVGSINVITSYHAMQHHNNPHLTAAKTAPDNQGQVQVLIITQVVRVYKDPGDDASAL